MNLTALPTLQKIVLLKLAARVCSVAEIKSLIEHYATPLSVNRSCTINEAISSFNLPKSLHERLVSLMKPVIIEIRSWILYIRHIHYEVSKFSRISCSLDEIDLQENLLWQSVGLLDKHLMTLDLIRDERLDPAFRFVLACSCCSEADILLLWQMLSEVEQIKFSTSEFRFLPVVNYWAERLNEAASVNYQFTPNPTFPSKFSFDDCSRLYLEAMFDFYEKLPVELRAYVFGIYGQETSDLAREIFDELPSYVAIQGVVIVDNVAAMKYFLHELEPMSGRKLLQVVAKNRFTSNELLVYCLSQMCDDQVTELLGDSNSRHRLRIISCLLNSPWQESFWELTDPIWNTLSTGDIHRLLAHISAFKLHGGWKDFDYLSITGKLWDRYQEMRKVDFSTYRKMIADFNYL